MCDIIGTPGNRGSVLLDVMLEIGLLSGKNISGAFRDHLYELKKPKNEFDGALKKPLKTNPNALKNKSHPQNVTVGVHFVFPKYGSQTAQKMKHEFLRDLKFRMMSMFKVVLKLPGRIFIYFPTDRDYSKARENLKKHNHTDPFAIRKTQTFSQKQTPQHRRYAPWVKKTNNARFDNAWTA